MEPFFYFFWTQNEILIPTLVQKAEAEGTRTLLIMKEEEQRQEVVTKTNEFDDVKHEVERADREVIAETEGMKFCSLELFFF